MVETGEWIMPQFTLGVPFWGKPPLSIWLSAGSMKLFGINEFAVRLPSFILGLTVIVLAWSLARRQSGKDLALSAALVLMSSGLFFFSSGAVMTDPSLLLGTTLCMVSFWKALNNSQKSGRIWGYAFFLGLAIGLLAKGPIAVVLTGLPIGIWVLLRKQWLVVWQRLPWVSGLFLTAFLSIPWYLMAELETPGFLEYFLIGEHWKRFTISGWEGDLYGNAHDRPMGTIWFYWLISTLPWSLLLFVIFLKNKRWSLRSNSIASKEDGWYLYLFLWAIAPMVFFTFAGNILWTYVLPGMPAFALVASEFLSSSELQKKESSYPSPTLKWGCLSMFVLFALALIIIVSTNYGPAEKSQKELVATFEKHRPDHQATLTYLFKRPYSAEFYSGGTAFLVKELDEATILLQDDLVNYFAIFKKDMRKLPESFLSRLIILDHIGQYYLLIEKEQNQFDSGKSEHKPVMRSA